MPNKVKYNPDGTENAIFKGNWAIDTSPPNSGGGPSSITGFYNGADAPEGGYVIYEEGAVRTIADDTELINYTNSKSGETEITTIAEALDWVAGQPNSIVTDKEFENIVTDGLILHYDAGIVASYPRQGTSMNDLSGSGNNASLINGVSYSSNSLLFDGTDDRLNLSSTISFSNADMTISYWFKLPGPIGLLNRRVLFNGPLGWFEFSAQSTILFRMRIDGSMGHKNLGFSPGLTLGATHNIVVTKTNNDFRVYNNGTIAATYIAPYLVYHPSVGSDSYPLDSSTLLEFSYSQFSGVAGRRFNGNLYNASIYNRALSAAEVLQNFNAQKDRFGL